MKITSGQLSLLVQVQYRASEMEARVFLNAHKGFRFPCNFAEFYVLELSHWICPRKEKDIMHGAGEMQITVNHFGSYLSMESVQRNA